jgi:glycosyltransferase involved in cell wall biosynthesis
MSSKPTIIIYRDELLGISETFIRAQAQSLSRYNPYFVGLRPLPGLDLPQDRTHVVTNLSTAGRIQRARFKYFGPNNSLLRHLEKLEPRLVHAHFGPDACNALPIAETLGIPLVVSLHGYDITRCDTDQSQLYLRRRAHLQEKAARFLCVSNFIRERALAKGFPAQKTFVHYTGVDTRFFQPKNNVLRLPVVLFVGRLVPEKGCSHLIQAMQMVQRHRGEAKLVMIGDGPLRAELEREAAARLTQYEFLGAKSSDVVRDWMNWANVFCAPSVMEGFGMVCAEAQAMGLPVVGFETGGVPEAVAKGESGLLVPCGDVQQLADSLIHVLSHAPLRERMGWAGQYRVATFFDIYKQTRALEETYDRVLGEARDCKASDSCFDQHEPFNGSSPPAATQIRTSGADNRI